MKVSELNKLIEESLTKEVRETILKETEGGINKFAIKCDEEYIELFDSEDDANKACEEYKNSHPNKEFTVTQETYESEDNLFDTLDEETEKLTNNMKKDLETNEELKGNQTKLDANNDGKISGADFKLLNKKETSESEDIEFEMEENIDDIVCEECGNAMCECKGEMKESTTKKKVLRLTETQLIEMIGKMVSESIPGIEAVKNAKKIGDAETKEHMSNVDKKIKKSLSFDGNDNPEFPKTVSKGDKKVVNNTEEQDEELNNARGENPLDLDYDNEPSEMFKDRLKKALEGDSTMGNAQGGNTIPTETGKNIAKVAEKRKKAKEDAPMYVKDVQPVKTVNEDVKNENGKTHINEDIEKMRKLSFYNQKTQ